MLSTQPIHEKYFPHIDGIRTIAVLPIVIYHILAPLCPGGYIGVDIFFVISGYLITLGILKQLERGTFTIKEFYTRRIRRIIPAYTALIFFILGVSLLIYGPQMLNLVTTATGYSAFFSTNIYFWQTTGGYWDPSAEINPLLHLWSLGVEEQFYIITPLLLLLIHKIRRNWLFKCLILLFTASLILSILRLGHRPISTFYMLPTRAWELLAGSLLAYTSLTNPAGHSKKYHLLGILGILICLATCYIYTSETPFPGAAALPPVLGAMLMIRYGGVGFANKLLSSKPFVWVGKISYSLYLWHWPFIVFWNYLSDHSTNALGLSGVFCASLIAAWLSWRFIEMPIRLAKVWNFKKAIAWVGASCGLILLSVYGIWMSYELNNKSILLEEYWKGAPSTQIQTQAIPALMPDREIWESHYTDEAFSYLGEDKSPSYLLIGDSHAMHLAPGFHHEVGKLGFNGLFLNRRFRILKSLNLYWYELETLNDFLLWIGQDKAISHIIVSNYWPTPVTTSSLDETLAQSIKDELRALCTTLKQANKKLIIMQDIPILHYNMALKHEKQQQLQWLSNTLLMHKWMPDTTLKGITYKEYRENQAFMMQLFTELQDEGLAEIVMTEDFFFSKKTDDELSKTLMQGSTPIYNDDNHLTPTGARALMEFCAPNIKKALNPAESAPH